VEKDLALIEQFLDALWLEKNLAENTLSAYRRDLGMLVAWLHHHQLSLQTAQSDDLQALPKVKAFRRCLPSVWREAIKLPVPRDC